MMKKVTIIALLCSLLVSNSLFSQHLESDETPYIQGEILVQLNSGYSIDQLVESFPVYTGLQAITCLSPHMRFYQLRFNHQLVAHPQMKRMLLSSPMVHLAQYNHFIEERATMPNDPNIGNQWHHLNAGGGGGVADADIDSDEAWDITTGGVTAMGDTIVVCLIEGGGANYNHVDLISNFWRNRAEIPNNGIDDDNNGYIDDYDGWNVSGNNDNHATGGHGTNCFGMIAAKGNNNVGVVGANWNCKVMLVSGFNTSESQVIAGYNYPLTLRKKYNQTNGNEGAFVVATSASWGIDQANPNNYPLWCAFYDTLGTYGILNVGATTNSNFNVDAVGDMPTACASPYMISVTRTGNADNQAGGYGATTIDLGAPGINVYTTSGSTSYTTTTGTSFSCPLTAGVIALMYSVPCTSLIALAKADPEAGANQIRTALFNGVDPKPSLNGITVTGGRLNAFNSVMELVNNCSGGSCITPFNLDAYNITDTDANLTWADGGAGTLFWVRYRVQGAPTWDSIQVTNDTMLLTGLTACTTYEFQVMSDCGGGDITPYSPITTFVSDGCCAAPATLNAAITNDTTASLSWNSVLAATGYNVQYSNDGGVTWTTVNNASSPLNLNTLSSCSQYEFQVQTICASSTTSFSPSFYFSMPGCGACEDLSYCANPGGDVSDEWIEQVELNTINNTSGANNGYMAFTGITTTLEQGTSYPITVTPGYAGPTYTEYIKVWIDWNQDGTFTEPTELAFSNTGTTTAATGTVSVPANAVLGTTRMRVALKYIGFGDNGAPTTCAGFTYGEVEDYCVDIATASGTSIQEESPYKFLVYPNPANETITVQFFGDFASNATVNLMNAMGQLLSSSSISGKKTTMDCQAFPNGIYFVQVVENGKTIRTMKMIIQH